MRILQNNTRRTAYHGTHVNTNAYLFFRRCEVGTNYWIQCNDTPVKFARFPVTGLVEGRSYIFRVRAVNKSGISHPSRVSEPVAAMDPADRARMRGTADFTLWPVTRNLTSSLLDKCVGHLNTLPVLKSRLNTG